MPFSELLMDFLSKEDPTERDKFELVSALQLLEADAWDGSQLAHAIKNSAFRFGRRVAYAGQENIKFDKSGITLKGGSQSVNEVKWANTLQSATRAFIRGSTDESANASMTIGVDGESDWTETLTLKAIGTTGDGAWIKIISDASQVGSMEFVIFFPVNTEKLVLKLLGDRAQFPDVIQIKERAASVSDDASYGQLWCKDDNPNVLRYTDGDGTEFIVNMTAV